MFQEIRYRLLWSYLGVLTLILSVFAIAVRTTFAYSLRHQLTGELTTLGQGAATSIEIVKGKLQADSDFSLKDLDARKQALQWFDLQGKTLGRQGRYILTLPLAIEDPEQVQNQVQGVTLPVFDVDTKQLVGYVRASESLQDLENTLQKLGLGIRGWSPGSSRTQRVWRNLVDAPVNAPDRAKFPAASTVYCRCFS